MIRERDLEDSPRTSNEQDEKAEGTANEVHGDEKQGNGETEEMQGNDDGRREGTPRDEGPVIEE